MLAKDIYALCGKFEKLAELSASKISIVQNADPILKEISDTKSFDKRVEIAEEHFDKLGEGSSRTIFKVSDKLVLKVAHNDKGIAQNLLEANPKAQRSITNPVLAADAQGKWILVRFTENITKNRFKELIGFKFDPFMDALFYKFNNESDHYSKPRNYDEIMKSRFFNELADLVFDCDEQIGDLSKIDSYGELNGRVVLRDSGLSRDIYARFYDKDSGSSSSPTPTPKSSTS